MSLTEKQEVDQFFQQLLFDIQEMQAHAIETQQTIIIQIYNYNQYKGYYALAAGDNEIFLKDIPKSIQFDTTSNLKRIIINPNGDVNEFGTMKFNTPFGETHLITYIKEGRMRLVEY